MTKITQITENKKNKERVSLFSDGEFLLSCHKELVVKKRLVPGMEVDVELLREMAREDEYLKAKDTALRALELSYKTEKEIEDKLRAKEYDERVIQRVMTFLAEYRLVDDQRYVELFAKEKLRSRGIRKVQYELQAKGIDKETFHEVLENLDTQSLEEETCKKLAEKKFAQLQKREPDVYKLKTKLFAFLSGKGYEYDMIQRIVRQVTGADLEP